MDPSDVQVEHYRPHGVDVIIRGSSLGPVESDTIHSSKKMSTSLSNDSV